MFDRVLVANRGEIALRIIRACRELGIGTVAVYSEADRRSPHVTSADEARLVGPAPAARSYLDIDRLIEVALDSGVDAVHPGYGFLAERADFAEAVEEAGLVFVGPRPETIAAMGDKTEARRRMQAASVPIVPGTTDPLRAGDDTRAVAEDVGYPLLVKAAAGGGGKGMRVVAEPDALDAALAAARRESKAAFGDDSVYLERYLTGPRHIEIQLLGDERGNVVHLGERECSIQRRHQKLIEEAPAEELTPEHRRALGDAAVRAARAVEYRGAGTVEFLFQDGDHSFLEMNTRLQVEHPVTELVTGVDLVHAQLRIASGEPLAFEQSDIDVRGHAIECRITAETPERGFLPSTGTVTHVRPPSGPGVRWDGGIEAGDEVGLHYDPLLGKLVVHAGSRPEAIRRMARALDELVIRGVDTSAPFLRRVMDEPDFNAGRLTIRYVEEHSELLDSRLDPDLLRAAAAIAVLEERAAGARLGVVGRADGGRAPTRMSAWRRSGWPWRVSRDPS